jgi:rhamnulokinase
MSTVDSTAVAAVDLGASSGRVMVGRVGPAELELTEVARFDNVPVRVRGTLHWDALRLYRGVLAGLRAAARPGEPIASIGVDAWGVDFGLFDVDGQLLGNPVHYRDSRTDGVLDRVLTELPAEEVYQTTGVQFLPFNTAYQLVAAAGSAQLAAAATLLLIPDLMAYWLTGELGAEATNASTTQLYDVRRRAWSGGLADRLGIPAGLLPPLREPGDTIGPLLPSVAAEVGLPAGTPVVAVGSHDTASAVVAVPARDDRFAYISCGTWSLVGLELDRPVLTEAARLANFTNEGGVDHTIRFLRNVMGLWLLQESLADWTAAGRPITLRPLLVEAAGVAPFRSLVDPDHPSFLPPGGMPARIAAECRRTGQPAPATPAETARCVLDSLAVAYRRTVRQAVRLSGRDVDVVHLVGGGARNELLCQLTADACGVPVLAGPVEATALGNVLVQARALGAPIRDLAAMRALLRQTQDVLTYRPAGDPSGWAAAEARIWPADDG